MPEADRLASKPLEVAYRKSLGEFKAGYCQQSLMGRGCESWEEDTADRSAAFGWERRRPGTALRVVPVMC